MLVLGRVLYKQITNTNTSTMCFEVLLGICLLDSMCILFILDPPLLKLLQLPPCTFTAFRLTVTMWRSTEQQILVCRKLQAMVTRKGRSSTLCHFRNDTPPLIFPLERWNSDCAVAQPKLKKRMSGSGGTWWDNTMTTAVSIQSHWSSTNLSFVPCYRLIASGARSRGHLSSLHGSGQDPVRQCSSNGLGLGGLSMCHVSPLDLAQLGTGSPAQSSWPNPNHRERKVATI